MQLLYKAYACEKMGAEKFLLPGYPVEATSKAVSPGKKIKVELADGTLVETIALGIKLITLDESAFAYLNVPSKPNTFYYAIQVPDSFSPTAVNLGVNVYLDD